MDIRTLWGWAAKPQREQEKTFQIDFPVVERAAPFSLSVTLSSYGTVFEHILNIDACGAAHPYDPNFDSGCIGDDNKNPALLPALRLLRTNLPVIAKTAMDAAGIGTRSMNPFDAAHNEGQPSADDHSTGLYCLLRFNPRDMTFPNYEYKPATAQQIGVLFDKVVDGLKKMEPGIRKTIEANRKEYPPIPLDQVEMLEHQASLSTHRLRVMMAAGIGVVASDEIDIEAMVRIAQQDGLKEALIARPDFTGKVTGIIRAAARRFG